eukprot:CAMPEP_0167744934 /NCGR_PEP_ID=MMETSP0110_2-20121227/2868_1 /TAXON_ID=629695 /ORGANISM="Gymnochlora sp., Strain CCMP2014" /LENGTH=376 /DNA_ID=CAMNT_0007629513 /DNA_START=166 /DNA_END=1296 /DNA_ORIENTATION=+
MSKGLFFYWVFGVAPGELHYVHPRYNDLDAQDYVVLVAMAKNEALYLEEWVEHAKRVGVDHIVLFDDSTPENRGEDIRVFNRLKDYIDSGFLELQNATQWDNKSFVFSSDISISQPHFSKKLGKFIKPFFYDKQQKMQIEMWRRFQSEVNETHHIWIGQSDIDEMYSPKTDDLKTILRRARVMGAKSIRMVKQEFGPSGLKTPPESMRTSYLLREKVGWKHTGLALVSAITGMASGCPHIYVTNSIVVDALRGTHECNNWEGESYSGEVRAEVYYAPKDEIVMNHYQTKSFSECMERAKVPHPDGEVVSRHCGSQKYTECDSSILRFVPISERKGLSAASCLGSKFREEFVAFAEEQRLEFCASIALPGNQSCFSD